MEDTAVLDAPELEAEKIETEGGESQQESSEGESKESTQQESHDEPAIVETDGKFKLSEKALARLNSIKAENPKEAREFRAALFDSAALRKEFPGGVKEAVELKQWRDEIGGEEAVEGIRSELDEWKGLDSDFKAGDPKFVADIAAGNPDAFTKIAPSVMSKYSELDPEGFSHQVSRVFDADMSAYGIPLAMERMKDFLLGDDGKLKPGMEGIARQWQALATYIDRVKGLATNAPKAKEGAKAATQTSEVEQREQALTIREFTTERNSIKNSITEAEFRKNAGSRKLPNDKISTIQELYESALNRAVQAAPGHKEKIDRYVAAKDRNGYRKYMDGVIRSKAGAAMAAAFRRAGVGDKLGPKKVETKPAAKPGVAATATAGFNRVGTKPNHNEVDWQSTARIAGKKGGDGKYIMRDGSKVLFQR